MLVTEAGQQKIRDAIANVERGTYAELVTVLAHRADNYPFVSVAWAAMLAMLTPAIVMLLPFWLEPFHILLVQAVVFSLAALLFRWQPILMKLVPKKLAIGNAQNLARRQFLQNNLHHTEGESGVLIFVAEAEHYVEIIADRGISRHVPDEKWQAIVDEFIVAVKTGRTEEGFLRCIQQCGALLQQHCPASENKNELPDRLVVV